MITTLVGAPASPLGLAAHPQQDPRCIARAFGRGINYFFFYSPAHADFIHALRPLLDRHREAVVVATGSGARKRSSLRATRKKILTLLGAETVDIFFAEYIHPGDDPAAIFGDGGVLDELTAWKAEGRIRYVGATAHDRPLARQLAVDPRVDVLMHRFNMAHRKAATEVFPAAIEAETPVVAFTATRWGSLVEPRDGWPGESPTAADCYHYCLAQPAVQIVLTAPKSLAELRENLMVLDSPAMSDDQRVQWERFGDLIYGRGGDAFETEWP